jgi:hypothetical protein
MAREMRTWFNDSPDRVAVLHCKGVFLHHGNISNIYLNFILSSSWQGQVWDYGVCISTFAG